MNQVLAEIKKPCRVDLNTMASNGKGKFCGFCQTSVIDFTNKTPEEISEYLRSLRGEHLCGTFNREHVTTENRLENFISYLHSGKLKFLSALVIGVLILTGCRSRKTTSTYSTTGRILDKSPQRIEHLK